MARLRCGALVAWTSAWLAGVAASDDVLRATVGDDSPHHVEGLPDAPAENPVPLSEALITWRRASASVRLVLPVAGDVRGLPGPAQFRSSALDAGEAVVGGGLGLVPDVVERHPSSVPATVVCALAAADVARWTDAVGDALTVARRAGERLDLPPAFPPPAVRLLAQAERLQAVLDLAALDPVGGAIDREGIAARTDALRSLATAVRRARLAAYNATF